METLESIADKLLEENGISVVEAEKISKGMKLDPLEFYDERNEIPEIESLLEGLMYPRDNAIEQVPLQWRVDDDLKSEIRYSITKDLEGKKYIMLDRANAFDEGKGYFGKVFRQLINIAFKNKISYIELEVKEIDTHAIEVYDHLEFISLGRVFDKPKYFCMRKDLVFD